MGLSGKRLVLRVDDLGYSDVYNIGAFLAFEKGCGSAADVMLDCPGTEDALRRLSKMPWMSVGWHTHFWGSPILPDEKVSTLINPQTGHFRDDFTMAEDVDEKEAYAELDEEIKRCIDILGKAPDVASFGFNEEAPYGRAMQEILDKYGIAYDFMRNAAPKNPVIPELFGKFKLPETPINPKWEDTKVYIAGMGSAAMVANMSDSIKTFCKTYDPIDFLFNDEYGISELPEGSSFVQAFHPGFVDDYVYFEGDHSPMAKNFILCRLVDLRALCSDRLKDWIRENGIILSTMKDALMGTYDYKKR